MDDITKELQSAIIVAGHYQSWRKGEIQAITYSPTEISMALEITIEAAKVLLILEQIKTNKRKKMIDDETEKRLLSALERSAPKPERYPEKRAATL